MGAGERMKKRRFQGVLSGKKGKRETTAYRRSDRNLGYLKKRLSPVLLLVLHDAGRGLEHAVIQDDLLPARSTQHNQFLFFFISQSTAVVTLGATVHVHPHLRGSPFITHAPVCSSLHSLRTKHTRLERANVVVQSLYICVLCI